jgi:hypothetical protein
VNNEVAEEGTKGDREISSEQAVHEDFYDNSSGQKTGCVGN